MARGTALESQKMVVPGDRAELQVADGRISLHKEATTQRSPTNVAAAVDQVRGVTVQLPTRNEPGWVHVSVVNGSPPPPGAMAAAGDPWTLPITSRGTSAARRLAKMVERHVQVRGLPSESSTITTSSGVVLDPDGPVTPKPERRGSEGAPNGGGAANGGAAGGGADLVQSLRELADLHASGALTDEEFQQAKDRLLR